jgi:hypothetical protein
VANERDDQLTGNDNMPLTTGERSQENEFGQRQQDAGTSARDLTAEDESQGRFGGEGQGTAGRGRPGGAGDDGMSGQPIGGNDSATGTGTTLTQGADFDAQAGESSSDRSGGDTLASNADGRTDRPAQFGQGTTSNSGVSIVGTDQTSGGSSGVAGGEGFIGSDASESDDYLRKEQDSGSAATAPRGSDFAREGHGALDEDDGRGPGSSDSETPS